MAAACQPAPAQATETPYAQPRMDETRLADPAPQTGPVFRRAEDPDEGLVLGQFVELEPGLELGLFHSEVAHPLGDGRVRVVRVDPSRREIVVRSSLFADGGSWRGADAWASAESLSVVINASMFHPAGESVFALQAPGGRHPTRWRDDANSALLAGPKDDKAPKARLANLSCAGGKPLTEGYATVVQGWRLIGCGGGPIWSRNAKIWSHALIGTDGQGRLLFIHARTPWNTRVFTEILQSLPIDVKGLQYAEGGPEASLVVRSGGVERVWVGSYETGFTEHDRNTQTWNLPSVVGVPALDP